MDFFSKHLATPSFFFKEQSTTEVSDATTLLSIPHPRAVATQGLPSAFPIAESTPKPRHGGARHGDARHGDTTDGQPGYSTDANSGFPAAEFLTPLPKRYNPKDFQKSRVTVTKKIKKLSREEEKNIQKVSLIESFTASNEPEKLTKESPCRERPQEKNDDKNKTKSIDGDVTRADGSLESKTTESAELQMAALYESLQSEAKKIQLFRVQATAQLKQKSDEIMLKQVQLKNVSLELSNTKSANSELRSKLKRQEKCNEDILSKVATTREMCFSMAERHEELKNLVAVGEESVRIMHEKANSHSNYIETVLEQLNGYKSSSKEALTNLQAAFSSKEKQYAEKINLLEEKELEITEYISELKTAKEHLEQTLDKKCLEILNAENEIENLKKNKRDLEIKMNAALEECREKQREEVADLKAQLEQQSITSQQDISRLHQAKCDLEVELVQHNEEILRLSKQTTEEKECNAKLEDQISDLKAEVEDFEKASANYKTNEATLVVELEKLKDKISEDEQNFKSLQIELDAEKSSFICKQRKLIEEIEEMKRELKEKSDENVELNSKISDLRKNETSLIAHTDSLRDTNLSLSSLVEDLEKDVENKTNTIITKDEEIIRLRDLLEKSNNLAKEQRQAMKSEMSQIKEDQDQETRILNDQITALESQITDLNNEMEKLRLSSESQKTEMEDVISSLKSEMTTQKRIFEADLAERACTFDKAETSLKKAISDHEEKLDEMRQKNEELCHDVRITKQSLEQSLTEKNEVVVMLSEKTQQLQDVSNKLLVKDCEFNKLLTAVQNLKSRCAAVATPVVSPANQLTSLDTCAVKPTINSSSKCDAVRTPEKKSRLLQHSSSANGVSGLAEANGASIPAMPNTPHTPRSNFLSDTPKGILRNEGSASKSTRVAFSTPIEQTNIAPSDSETSVIEIEAVNRSIQGKATPDRYSQCSPGMNKLADTPKSVSPPVAASKEKKASVVTPSLTKGFNDSVSPNCSVESGDRLPRSKVIRQNKKRLRPSTTKNGRDLTLDKTMKKHRAAVGYGRPVVRAVRESDSDCFGFGSE